MKIDGAYVRQVLASPRDAAILKSIARLCRDLEIGCIAEMIKSQARADKLSSLGVRYGQGFHCGRPTPTRPTRGARIFTGAR